MKSRSSSANMMAMCAMALPIGVRVSMPISVTISRQSCSADRRSSAGEVLHAAASRHRAEGRFLAAACSVEPAGDSYIGVVRRFDCWRSVIRSK